MIHVYKIEMYGTYNIKNIANINQQLRMKKCIYNENACCLINI